MGQFLKWNQSADFVEKLLPLLLHLAGITHIGFHAMSQTGGQTLPVTTLGQFPQAVYFYKAEGRKNVARIETWQMRLLNPEEKFAWQLYTINVFTCPVSPPDSDQ